MGVSESWTFEVLRLHAKTLGVRERGSVEVVDSAGMWWQSRDPRANWLKVRLQVANLEPH